MLSILPWLALNAAVNDCKLSAWCAAMALPFSTGVLNNVQSHQSVRAHVKLICVSLLFMEFMKRHLHILGQDVVEGWEQHVLQGPNCCWVFCAALLDKGSY